MYIDFAIIYNYGKVYIGMYDCRTKRLNAYSIINNI